MGKRRNALAIAADQMFAQDFADHCLAFDAAAAKNYALIVAKRTHQGQPSQYHQLLPESLG